MNRLFFELQKWFAERNIPADGITVILNFNASHPAAIFDAAMRQELAEVSMTQLNADDLTALIGKFEYHGIKVIVESPIHGQVHT